MLRKLLPLLLILLLAGCALRDATHGNDVEPDADHVDVNQEEPDPDADQLDADADADADADQPDADDPDADEPDADEPTTVHLFVSPDGDDSDNGMTTESPLQTLGAAIDQAHDLDGPVVILLTAGDEFVADRPIEGPVSIRGGMVVGDNQWTADGEPSQILSGGQTWGSLHTTLILTREEGDRDEPAFLEQLVIQPPPIPTTPATGVATVVAHRFDVDAIHLQDVTILGGEGSDGRAGANAENLSVTTGSGQPGNDGFEASANATVIGGGGGSNSCGGAGGAGGNAGGCEVNGGQGQNGEDGTLAGGSAQPGAGGAGGDSWCSQEQVDGEDQGQNGEPGVNGAHGTPGSFPENPFGSIGEDGWQPVAGQAGTNGQSGGGGGGGGAGGSGEDSGGGVQFIAASGGGGGAGGCGGQPGDNGEHGGISIALLLVDAIATFDAVTLVAGEGGDAGRGGDSNCGRSGAAGGPGGEREGAQSGDGGDGGPGGRGGDGGPGAGGHGGATIGLAIADAPLSFTVPITFEGFETEVDGEPVIKGAAGRGGSTDCPDGEVQGQGGMVGPIEEIFQFPEE